MPDNEGQPASGTVWNRGGVPVEHLPDPFAPIPRRRGRRGRLRPALPRRRWPLVLYAVGGILFITLLWLVLTAPLSRALEPLDDPALRITASDGTAIARRGAIKEAPVDVDQARPADPGRVHRDRGPALLPPLGHRPARDRPRRDRQHAAAAGSARAAARSPSSSPRPASSAATAPSSARRRR